MSSIKARHDRKLCRVNVRLGVVIDDGVCLMALTLTGAVH